jgi:hypothetical protein
VIDTEKPKKNKTNLQIYLNGSRRKKKKKKEQTEEGKDTK